MENKYFVSCIDKWMSGWGRSEGKKNKLIFVCESTQEVEQITKILENNSNMKYIYPYTSNFPKKLLKEGEIETDTFLYQLKSAKKWIKNAGGGRIK